MYQVRTYMCNVRWRVAALLRLVLRLAQVRIHFQRPIAPALKQESVLDFSGALLRCCAWSCASLRSGFIYSSPANNSSLLQQIKCQYFINVLLLRCCA